MEIKKHAGRKKRILQRGPLFRLFISYKRLPYKMNWKNRQRRTKQVEISLEYIYNSDLTSILTHLSDLISSGVEMYSGELKSLENEDKSNKFNFIQSYSGTVHESKESEINGVLKLVIKSKL